MDLIDAKTSDWVNPVPSSAVQQQIGDACVKLLNVPEEACAVCGEFIQLLSVPSSRHLTRSELPAAAASLLSVERGTWSAALKLQYCVHPTVCAEPPVCDCSRAIALRATMLSRSLGSSPRVRGGVCPSSCTDVVSCVGCVCSYPT